jgi:hypothetical protein
MPCVVVRSARFHPHFASHCDCVPETGDPLGIALPEGHPSHRLMLPPVTDVLENHVLRLPVKMAVFKNRVSRYLLSIPPRPFPPQTSPRAVLPTTWISPQAKVLHQATSSVRPYMRQPRWRASCFKSNSGSRPDSNLRCYRRSL